MNSIAFDTGRPYSAHGQRIAAVELPSTGRIAFLDTDRGIDGVLFFGAELNQRAVMHYYDNGLYHSLQTLTPSEGAPGEVKTLLEALHAPRGVAA